MHRTSAAPYSYLILVRSGDINTHGILWPSVCSKQPNPHLSVLSTEVHVLKSKGRVLELLVTRIRYKGARVRMLYRIRADRHLEIYDDHKLVASTVTARSGSPAAP